MTHSSGRRLIPCESLSECGANRLTCEKYKLIPVYSPYTKKVCCLDELAAQYVERHRDYFKGSEFERDPVQTVGLLLLLDVEFMCQAKVLRMRDGRWVSLPEAAKDEAVRARAEVLLSRYTAALAALEQRHPREFAILTQAFADGLEIVNAVNTGGRVADLVESLLDREQFDPGAYRRAALEVRAALIQADLIRAAEAEATGGKVRTPEAAQAAKDAATTAGTLVVIVRRSGQPLPQATVLVLGGATSAAGRTDAAGQCTFPSLTRGSYTVRVLAAGAREEKQAEVPGGGMATSVAFDLVP